MAEPGVLLRDGEGASFLYGHHTRREVDRSTGRRATFGETEPPPTQLNPVLGASAPLPGPGSR